MKKDILKTYLLEVLLLAILFLALFVSNKMSYIILALVLTAYAVLVWFFSRKRRATSIHKKEVTVLMIAFAIIYLALFFLIGVIINDFARQPITFGFKTLYRFIIPLTAIIISSEVIRSKFQSQNGKIRFLKFSFDLSKLLTFINMVLIEIVIYIGVYDLSNYNEFLTAIGFVAFSAISCNLLYTYVAKRYGIVGIIAYRLITTLYVYIIPIVPNIYIYFRSFLRMLYPYFLYLITEKTFSRSDFVVARIEKRKTMIGVSVLVVVMTLITMLISCQFKYGILVIGSGSMKGTLNIGDAVIYERHDEGVINEGEVIVFEKNGLKLIHRIVDVRKVNGQIRYYTKGDANEKVDVGYVTDEEIVGVTKLRILYIGYPTIWMRQLFN